MRIVETGAIDYWTVPPDTVQARIIQRSDHFSVSLGRFRQTAFLKLFSAFTRTWGIPPYFYFRLSLFNLIANWFKPGGYFLCHLLGHLRCFFWAAAQGDHLLL